MERWNLLNASSTAYLYGSQIFQEHQKRLFFLSIFQRDGVLFNSYSLLKGKTDPFLNLPYIKELEHFQCWCLAVHDIRVYLLFNLFVHPWFYYYWSGQYTWLSTFNFLKKLSKTFAWCPVEVSRCFHY